jgi:16S rRNA C967 or C1407 C5-methylase (RsmB/RsmF family)
MDAGSLLPVLALDLAPGHGVLDMCAGPGGKALLALQTLYPGSLVCNDINGDRLGRVGSVVEQFCGPGQGAGGVRDTISFSRKDARNLLDYGIYDRVLCDVPCFSDRHAVSSEENNIFSQKMLRNRLQLPAEQCGLLKAGLQYLKPGGSLVYSTCTLSPVQNEGVVNMALKSLWEETSLKFVVADLTPALRPFRWLYIILGPQEGIRLGNLIVPSLMNNFGPTYFCKITRKL